MLPIVVRTTKDERHVRPTAEELSALVHRIGGEHDYFLIVQRLPDLPDDFFQVWHKNGDDYYETEYRVPPGRQYQFDLDSADEVFQAALGWARRTPDWASQHAWELMDDDPIEPPAELTLSNEDRETLEAEVRLKITAGYEARSDLSEIAEEYLVHGDERPVSKEQATALVDRLWLARVREQESWEGETDPDRLTRAFRALDGAGIIAREHFMCCRSCGLGGIGQDATPETRGFVFFHWQSTDGAAAGGGLMLYYGGFDGSEATTTSVGHEVVAALESAGLPVDWNGDPGTGINVTPIDWRKRLIG